ncbi:tetratricopeptide repeat protein [Dongia sp.]|uniref:tetratricopeptide repeat protein n=1 Tax=Dongia sp. TaxID=1977262 RepID=UPI0035B08A9C
MSGTEGDAKYNGGKIAAVLKSSEAQALAEKGRNAEALILYEEAIQLCPPISYRGNLRTLYGALLFDMGDVTRAREAFTAAITDECMFPYESYRRLAFAYAAEGSFNDASGCMLLAAEKGEDAAFAAQAISTYRFAIGHRDQAMFFVQEDHDYTGCEADPRMRVCLVRAEIQRRNGQLAAARRSLDDAAAIAEDMPTDIALWLSALDKAMGNSETRGIIADALSDKDDICSKLHDILDRPELIEATLSDISSWDPMIRAEFAMTGYRLSGLCAETAGNMAAAQNLYSRARIDARMQWLIHYHMAAGISDSAPPIP